MNHGQPPRLPLPTSTCTTCILRQQITCTSTLHKQASSHGLKMTMASPSASPTAPPVESTQAHVLEAPRKLGLRQIRLESFSPMDVQIRIHSVAISTTDIMYFETNLHNGRPLHGPIILGREATGEIIAVGAMAARTWPHLQIGSRIAIEPGIPCRICHDCASGKYNICVNMRAAANASREPYVHGFLRQYLNWPGEMVHP